MSVLEQLDFHLKQSAVGVLGLDVDDALLVVAGFPVVVGVLDGYFRFWDIPKSRPPSGMLIWRRKPY